jgi:hypothetical protein
MPKMKSDHDDDDYVESPEDTGVYTQLRKYQNVTIGMNQSAVVMEPIPNQRGEILVQFMKWVPLSKVETKVCSTGGRRSSRTKHRPGYLVEDETFFTLPDSKYSSNTRQTKLFKRENFKGAGSMVTHAFVHDTVKGVFYNVRCRNSKFNRLVTNLNATSRVMIKNTDSGTETKVDCNDSPVSTEKNSDPSCEITDSFDSSDDEVYLPDKSLRTSSTLT